MASQSGESVLCLDNLNPCIKVMEYAVRGPLVARAGDIEKELEKVTDTTFLIIAVTNHLFSWNVALATHFFVNLE